MGINISVPKGTRDFLPVAMQRRNYIFSVLRDVFCLHGYQPIETPAMEDLSTLLGKYGEEGDKLLFRIIKNGDYLKDAEFPISVDNLKGITWNDISPTITWDQLSGYSGTTISENSKKMLSKIGEKGLRYDLTVPFARFVVMHRNELTFPFKRYQIQPVWRADRPQKGRYREFFQCDVDVIGSDSLLNELELLQIIEEVFSGLKLDITIILNNRKILQGIADYIGLPDKLTDVTIAIDKMDKTGIDGVVKELTEKGFPSDSILKLVPVLDHSTKNTSNEDVLTFAKKIITSEEGKKGITEMEMLLNYARSSELSAKIKFELSLARGLSYYTGTILEVKTNEVQMGSLCGGGRYDNLTGIFGLPDVSGVGMSFGADRIYDVLESLNKFPEELNIAARVLLVNFGHEEEKFGISVLQKLHKSGISAELYPDPGTKMKKQMSYADAKKIPFVIMAGENEIKNGKVSLKNMTSGEQQEFSVSELINHLKNDK